MTKYILTCYPDELKGFTINKTKDYYFLPFLSKGKYLFIDAKTKEIEFSDSRLLEKLNGRHKVVR